MKVLAALAGTLALVLPATADAARFVGETSQGEQVRLRTLSNGRVFFRINADLRCSNGLHGGYHFGPDRPPRLDAGGRFRYRERGRGRGGGGVYTYRFR